MKNSAKFLIISLTAAVVVACPVTPEGGGDSSAAREYKITYTVSGSDSVTVNGPATAKSGDTVTFTIDGIEFDKRLVSVEYRLQRSNRRIQFHHAGTGYPRHCYR